jgi:putative nucleotidyltransferase with HDIG domain
MKKKFLVEELKFGMYVAELDRPWLETPFIFQGFTLQHQEQLDTLARYCEFVFVDLDLSLPEPDKKTRPAAEDRRKRPLELEPLDKQRIELEILRDQARATLRAQPYTDQTTLEEEISRIQDNYMQCQEVLDEVLDDAQFGRKINMPGVRQLIGSLAESVIRNPDAAMLLAELRRKDKMTVQHSMRVSVLALALGRQLGLEEEALQVLGVGALLHDIGKVKIPDELLNKPGELTEREAEFIKRHVPFGLDILRRQAPDLPTMALEVVGWHHERYDGTGYMTGAKGNDISQFGYIGGLVDHFDAITSDRPWRRGIGAHTALMHMYDRRGKSFHPELTEQFIRCIGVYPIGSVVQLNTGDTAVVITRNRERYLRPRVVVTESSASGIPGVQGRILDLARQSKDDDRYYEIVRVLDPEEHRIDPARYFPLLAA